jgi:HK97 gp10 family phage protein
MSDRFFDIQPTPATMRHFEVFVTMDSRYIHAVRQTLYRMGKIFYDDARMATMRGPRTGENLLPRKYGRNIHASAPGESPQRRSGFLRSKLGFNVVGMRILHFRDDAPYAGFLEDGTRKMAKRPFMQPAIQGWGPMFPEIGRQEMEKAMGGAA